QVQAWNQTQRAFPAHLSLSQLFEAQVQRTPQAIALLCEEHWLTYEELNLRANQLAHHLRSLGVGPEVPVGLCLQRSSELLIALLGVLKAGGAYVPLEPEHPVQRLKLLLQDAAPAVVLTQSALREKLLACLSREALIPVLCLDRQEPNLLSCSSENLPSQTTPDTLAYLLYTSGSTGVPKGVMISQRALVNYVSWCMQRYGVAGRGRALVSSPVSFDLTVTSLFPALLAGNGIWLLPAQSGVEALSQALQRGEQYSVMKITPAHVALLEHALPEQQLSRVGTVVIGGEQLLGE